MFLSKINIRIKSYLALSFLLVNLLLTLYYFINISDKDIDFAVHERYGIKVITPLYDALNSLIQYRAAYLQPKLLNDNQITILETRIENSFNLLKTIDQAELEKIKLSPIQLNTASKANLDISSLEKNWHAIKPLFKNNTSSFLQKSQDLKQNIIDLISYAGDQSNLILDPDLDSYYLIDIFVIRLSTLYNNLDLLNDNFLQTISSKNSPDLEKTYYNLIYEFKKFNFDIIDSEINTVLKEDANFYGISASLQANLPVAQKALENYSSALITYLNSKPNDASIFYNKTIEYLNIFDSIVKTSSIELDKLLEIRISYLIDNKNKVTYISLLGIIISLIFSYLIISLLIVNPINKLCIIMHKIIQGSIETEIPYLSNRDEIGDIASAIEKLKASLKENYHLIEAGKIKDIEKAKHIELEQNRDKTINTFKNKFLHTVDSLKENANHLEETSNGLHHETVAR